MYLQRVSHRKTGSTRVENERSLPNVPIFYRIFIFIHINTQFQIFYTFGRKIGCDSRKLNIAFDRFICGSVARSGGFMVLS